MSEEPNTGPSWYRDYAQQMAGEELQQEQQPAQFVKTKALLLVVFGIVMRSFVVAVGLGILQKTLSNYIDLTYQMSMIQLWTLVLGIFLVIIGFTGIRRRG